MQALLPYIGGQGRVYPRGHFKVEIDFWENISGISIILIYSPVAHLSRLNVNLDDIFAHLLRQEKKKIVVKSPGVTGTAAAVCVFDNVTVIYCVSFV